jgi:hypothetical protein
MVCNGPLKILCGNEFNEPELERLEGRNWTIDFSLQPINFLIGERCTAMNQLLKLEVPESATSAALEPDGQRADSTVPESLP